MIKGIVGIECGSKKSSISKFGRLGLENITSESSNRDIPSVIVYTEEQRLFAELACDRVKAYPQSTVFSPFRLCQVNAAAEAKDGFCFFVLQEQLNKGEKHRQIVTKQGNLLFEQVIGSYFTYLDTLIMKNISKQGAYVCMVSVPNHFTLVEKIKMQQAYSVAILPCLGFVEEHQAVAYSYLQFSKNKLSTQTKRVLFVDVGETQISCFIYFFQGYHGHAEFVDSRGDVGVRTIDRGVYAFLADKYPHVFSQGKGINKKSMLRIQEAIERLRKVLSSNTEQNLLVECVAADEDLQHSFTRTEFESIIQLTGFIAQLEELLNGAVSFCFQSEVNIDEVEILGGGTRIPLIVKTIKSFLRKEKIGIAFQGSETISRGCAIACAVTQPQVNSHVKIEPYKLTTTLGKESVVELFLQGKKCAEQKYLLTQYLPYQNQISASVPKSESEDVLLLTIELKFNGIAYKTTEHHLHPTEVVNIRYRIQENGHLIVISTSIDISQKAMLEEALDKRQRSVTMKMTIEGDPTDDDLILSMVNAEKKARESDEKIVLKQEMRNQLEQYMMESLQYAQEKGIFAMKSEEVKAALKIVQQNKEEIEGNFKLSLEDILSRTAAVKKAFEPLKSLVDPKNSMKAGPVVVNNLEQLKSIATANANKEVKNFELLIANQSMGDGNSFIMNMFKNSGSIKIKEYLSMFTISKSLTLVLSNNSFSDAALENIFSALESKVTTVQQLTDLRINLESNLLQQNTNVFTMDGLVRVSQFIERLQNLENISITVNYLDKPTVQKIQNVLINKKKIKNVQLTIRNFDVNPDVDRHSFIMNLNAFCDNVTLDCYSSRGVKLF